MSTSIYDRSNWPDDGENPLINLVNLEREWFSSSEIIDALGYPPGRPRSFVSQWPSLIEQIGEDHTALHSRGFLELGGKKGRQEGGQERLYSKKALILICTRARTRNAAAFLDWLAQDVVEDIRFHHYT